MKWGVCFLLCAVLATIGCSKEPAAKGAQHPVNQRSSGAKSRSSGIAASTASGSTQNKQIAKCAAMTGDLDRLGCFDRLAKALNLQGPQSLPISASGAGKWLLSRDKNPIDDSERVLAVLTADTGKGRFGDTIALVARCQSNKTEAYINWNTFLGSDSQNVYSDWKEVTMRIGNEPAKSEPWDVSTDKKATFAPGVPAELLKRMAAANKFVAQVTPYDESPITAIFDTTGMSNILKPLAKACGWKF